MDHYSAMSTCDDGNMELCTFFGGKKDFLFFFLSSVPDGENFRLGMSLVPT